MSRWHFTECLWITSSVPYAMCKDLNNEQLLFTCSVALDSLWPRERESRQASLYPSPRVCSDSCPLSQWCHPRSHPVVHFSSYLQFFPESGSFPMSRLFESGGQSIGASASASVLPMNIQDWFPLGSTGLISLQSKGVSRVFSNTVAQKHQFFGTQPSLWSNHDNKLKVFVV